MEPVTTSAAPWWKRLILLHRLGMGRMTVEEYEAATAPSNDDGSCRVYGHVATGSDLRTCTVCGADMP